MTKSIANVLKSRKISYHRLNRFDLELSYDDTILGVLNIYRYDFDGYQIDKPSNLIDDPELYHFYFKNDCILWPTDYELSDFLDDILRSEAVI